MAFRTNDNDGFLYFEILEKYKSVLFQITNRISEFFVVLHDSLHKFLKYY